MVPEIRLGFADNLHHRRLRPGGKWHLDEVSIQSANSQVADCDARLIRESALDAMGEIPTETIRVAFPQGRTVTCLRDEFDALYEDEDFQHVYPSRGQPGLIPRRLALVTVLQVQEHLGDRQAAEAVRAWIDQKYALGLVLTDPGSHFSVLTVPGAAGDRPSGASAAGQDAGAVQGVWLAQGARQAAHRQHICAGGRA